MRCVEIAHSRDLPSTGGTRVAIIGSFWRNRNRREESDGSGKSGQSKTVGQCPTSREEVAVEADRDDDKPLEPHADAHNDGDGEQSGHMAANFWNQRIAGAATLQNRSA